MLHWILLILSSIYFLTKCYLLRSAKDGSLLVIIKNDNYVMYPFIIWVDRARPFKNLFKRHKHTSSSFSKQMTVGFRIFYMFESRFWFKIHNSDLECVFKQNNNNSNIAVNDFASKPSISSWPIMDKGMML